MTPATIALGIQLVEALIQEEPKIQAELVSLFSKPNPTPADWQALRDKVLSQSYSSLVPDSTLPQS